MVRDCIKSDRVRNIIAALIGKVVVVTEDDDTSREKIISGIGGVGDVPEMGQLTLTFEADYKKDNGGTRWMQVPYEDWEELIRTGKTDMGGIGITVKFA